MEWYDIAFRIILATIFGGTVGYERKAKKKPAGLTTHMLVCVGACVVSLVQVRIVENSLALIKSNPELVSAIKVEQGRVIAQVVSGVGFLGAGAILVNKGTVVGITTASTLWLVACLGLAIGSGYYLIALIAVLVVLFVLLILKRFEVVLFESKKERKIIVIYKNIEEEYEASIINRLKDKGIVFSKIKPISEKFVKGDIEKKVLYDLFLPKYLSSEIVFQELKNEKNIKEITQVE